MSRFVRNTLIQFKLESTYGTDPGSWSATDALLLARATFDNPQESVARELLRGHMGSFEQINTTGTTRISFDLEFSGSGAADTAPAWGKVLRACGMAETITASTKVQYSLVSTGFESATIRYSCDGVIYTVRGCRGTATVRLNAFGLPYLAIEIVGLNATAAAAATPAGTFTAWQPPLPVTSGNGGVFRVGGTINAGAVISGGASVQSQDLEFMIGNQIQHQKFLGSEEIDITQREATGRGVCFLPAADEVTWFTAKKANTLASFGFTLGSAAGATVVVWAPAVQRSQLRHQDYQGRVVTAFDLRLVPTAANDEFVIVSR